MSKRQNLAPFGLKKTSIEGRVSKVSVRDFAEMPPDFEWYEGLATMIPKILRGKDLERLADRIVRARRRGRPVILMMGAHVVKCGLDPLLVGLMRSGMVTGIAMNGACAIHDLEIAMWGRTSEDVAGQLRRGSFGMTEETAAAFNRATARCLRRTVGLGASLADYIREHGAPYGDLSILACAATRGIPATVHVAIGTDVVHEHEEADGKAIGIATLRDFRTFTSLVMDLRGGVAVNIGSAVIMPEVFLKALAIARNRGVVLGPFTTANFDMVRHYRPSVNVVERPRLLGATSYEFVGSHEILLPVFVAAVMARNDR